MSGSQSTPTVWNWLLPFALVALILITFATGWAGKFFEALNEHGR